MFTSTSLQIGDLTEKQMAVIANNILSLNINYTMDMASQLSFVVIDPAFEMASNNYFQVGRDVVYETTSIGKLQIAESASGTGFPITTRTRHIYEISSVSVQQNGSASPQWSVEAMPKAIQQMKRDKTPSAIGGSGYSFVQKAANKYGLRFVGEKSSRIKSASKNSGDGQQDSVWTIIQNIAQQSQYVVFVADGYLYFGSQKWLLHKWGTEKIEGKEKKVKGKVVIGKKGIPEKYPDKFFIPMEYPPTNERNSRRFEVLSLPNLRKSDNDPMEGTGNLLVARDNGVQLRPGMTIRINNVPTMNQFYLITSVSFSEQTTDPVSVEFRTPERLEVNGKTKIPQLPVGKIFESIYFQPSPRLGATTVGTPVFNDTTPPFVEIGTTINPVGPRNIGRIPNSRRGDFYPTTKAEMNYIKPTFLINTDILVAGNIDCLNRPVYITNSDDSTKCATLYPHVYSTTIEGDNVFVITERLWCSGGVPTILSTGNAETKYETEDLHHGIFGTLVKAQEYAKILILVQKEVIKRRFPNSWEKIWNGIAEQIGTC